VSKSDSHERRLHRRVPASLLPSLTARLSGGSEVKLLDVSHRGVRLQTKMHMRPGQTVAIRFMAADATVTLSAAVVRATVARVDADGIRYETALSLAGDLLLCEQLESAALEPVDGVTDAPDATAHPDPPDLGQVVDFTVIVKGPAETVALFDGLQANSW
jgi:hypothetical protein